jgi:rod shape determining protein RodA
MEAYRRPRPHAYQRTGASLFERVGFTRLDPIMLFAAVALIAYSVYTLGVATAHDVPGNPYYYVVRQSIYAVVGIALMFGVARIDYSRFRELRVGIYTLGKVLLVVTLAAFVLDRARAGTERRLVLRILILGMTPAALVFIQPDLGTALVYGVITLAVLFIAGIRWQYFATLIGVIVAVILGVLVIAPAAGVNILAPYQQDRLTAFLHPSDDPAESSYQINQALIAVGSGGKTGRGDDATQTQNGFLPERQTDFIFAVVGERFGFIGAAFLLFLYALLIWRALRTMTLSKNLYGSMIAGAIAAMLMFQVFINIGMNLGIMPITGIPLPLMSSGGSSVIVTFLAIGLLQSIYSQAQLTSKRGSTPF